MSAALARSLPRPMVFRRLGSLIFPELKLGLWAKLLQEQVPEQDVPLSIPKKTRVYVEQTKREREKASEMHKGFQRDLCKLRLSTARAYVKTITTIPQGRVTEKTIHRKRHHRK